MLSKNLKGYFKSTLIIMIFTALIYVLPSPVSFVCEALAAAFFAKLIFTHNYKFVLATGAVILAVIAAFGGVYGVLISGVAVILLALTLGMGTKLKLSYYKILFVCSAIYLLSSAVLIMLAKSTSVDIFSLEYFYDMMNSMLSNMSESGYMVNPEIIDEITAYIKATVLFMMQITPAMMIIISVFCGFILTQIYKYVLLKSKSEFVFSAVPFDKMRASRMSGAMFLVFFLLLSVSMEGLFADTLLNVVIVLAFLFFACGLSLLDWQLKMRGTKKSSRRIMEIAILPLSYMLMMTPLFVIIAMGLADSLFDFRKQALKK